MRRLLLIVGGSELALFIATRFIIGHWSAWEWQAELLRTACRGLVALVLWHFGRTIILGAGPRRPVGRDPRLVAALLLLFAVPFLVGDLSSMAPATRLLFALTSLVVGLHEEFLFRGIVQNLLERRLGTLKAVFVTSAAMTAWHIGAVFPHYFSYWQVFAISGMLGLIYAATRSMRLVVLLHTLYDASWSATPVLAARLDFGWGALILLIALGLTWRWAQRAGFTPAARPPDAVSAPHVPPAPDRG